MAMTAPVRPGWHRAGAALLWLAVTLYMVLSAFSLARLGVPYDLPGGSPLAKMHPGTYVLVLALLAALAGQGHPVAVLWQRLRALPLVTLYLLAMLVVAVWTVWLHGTGGTAFIVDTLWMPGVALLVMSFYGPGFHRALLGWVIGLLVLNSFIALGEYTLQRTLFEPPQIRDGSLVREMPFRAGGLLGHPLANGLVTVSLMPAALLAPWRGRLRWPVLGLFLLALLAFGGRTALALAVVVYGGAALVLAALRLVQGRYSYLQMTGGAVAALLTVTGLVAVVGLTGLGERIVHGMQWDNSANVRLVVWQALDHLDLFSWWVGMTPDEVERVAVRIGLDPRYEAIENFWIALLMQTGLLGFVPFVLGLACGVAHVWRVAPPFMRMTLPVYFFVASGANTLASKSVSLTLLFVVLACSAAWRVQPAAPGRAAARMPRVPSTGLVPGPFERGWR